VCPTSGPQMSQPAIISWIIDKVQKKKSA